MSRRAPSRGAVGWITFAGFVMIISGGFSVLQGLGMLINTDQFPNSDLVFSQDATTWGWVQLLVGAIVLLAGFGVFSGNLLARTAGVLGALISALASFVAIGIIAVDLAVIWALTAHGRDVQRMSEMSETRMG